MGKSITNLEFKIIESKDWTLLWNAIKARRLFNDKVNKDLYELLEKGWKPSIVSYEQMKYSLLIDYKRKNQSGLNVLTQVWMSLRYEERRSARAMAYQVIHEQEYQIKTV